MRYARQEKLIGKQAQKELSKKTVAIVGLGALGTNVSSLLARSGINLKLIDFDKIDLTNLQRQSLYTEKNVKEINSEISITSFNEKLNDSNLHLLDSNLVIDCTDNLTTRFLINDYC